MTASRERPQRPLWVHSGHLPCQGEDPVKNRGKTMQRLMLLGLIGLLAEGCSTYAADRYAVSADNITAIKRAIAAHPGTKLGVAPSLLRSPAAQNSIAASSARSRRQTGSPLKPTSARLWSTSYRSPSRYGILDPRVTGKVIRIELVRDAA
jgi:hypothetical protein